VHDPCDRPPLDVSIVNRPSKYDYTRSRSLAVPAVSGSNRDEPRVSVVNRPSKYVSKGEAHAVTQQPDQFVAVSVVNRPSKSDYGITKRRARHAASRSSTDRASTISCSSSLSRSQSSPQPSTDRASTIAPWTSAKCELSLSSTDRASSISVAEQARPAPAPVSAVNRPSKYESSVSRPSTDRATLSEIRVSIRCLGRQPTEQVR
jgi:hypothetical protein